MIKGTTTYTSSYPTATTAVHTTEEIIQGSTAMEERVTTTEATTTELMSTTYTEPMSTERVTTTEATTTEVPTIFPEFPLEVLSSLVKEVDANGPPQKDNVVAKAEIVEPPSLAVLSSMLDEEEESSDGGDSSNEGEGSEENENSGELDNEEPEIEENTNVNDTTDADFTGSNDTGEIACMDKIKIHRKL